MRKILNFTIIDLPSSKLLFSYQRADSPSNPSLKSLIFSLLPQIVQHSNISKKPLILQPKPSIFFYSFVDFSKKSYFIGFIANFPLISLEKTMQILVENANKFDFSMISFSEKRAFEEKLEFLACEIEENREEMPGFSQVQKEIGEINNEMKKNITKMVIAQENLMKIDKKADKMAEIAIKFKENAQEYREKHEGFSKNFWILMGIFLVIIIVVLIIIIAFYSSNTAEIEEIPLISSNYTLISQKNLNNINKIDHFIVKKP